MHIKTRSGGLSTVQIGYLLILPALTIIGLVSVYPFFETIWYSLHKMQLNLPIGGWPYVGLRNYAAVLSSAHFQYSLWITFLFAATFVLVELVFGMLIALVLNLNFWGRAFVRASILVPWAMALVLIALLWQYMYNASLGVINAVLQGLGIEHSPIDWLATSDSLAFFSVMVVDVWRNTPFMAIVLLAGLQSIPSELYEAARIDGAGRIRSYFGITLPLLRHAILIAVLFRSIDAIRAFDLLFVLTKGGPGYATQIASLYSYRMLFSFLNFGEGSASTIVLAILTMVLAIVYIRFLGRGD